MFIKINFVLQTTLKTGDNVLQVHFLLLLIQSKVDIVTSSLVMNIESFGQIRIYLKPSGLDLG